ncbi:MAG TPA: carboxypeptidase-like regulatory domain-containing protein, partial [Longimicrobium sp.]|nr:carboxypeptidase-like regulatory domain-containing protein [Longimicrobium sp.]
MRARRWTIAAAAILLSAAGCGDFLAPPAGGDARLSLALAPGAPAEQDGLAELFDAVDGLAVRVSRGQATVMADSFAVSPAGGVIRRTLLVPLDDDEEELELEVELHADGEAVFAGARTVRLARGARTSAEIELLPVEGFGTGSLEVGIFDAVSVAPLPASVALRRGADASADDPIAAAAVGSAAGVARFDSLPAGPYTLFVSAPGMIASTVAGVAVAADRVASRFVALSPVLAPGETRVVLTWGAAPR